ncbi:hypothetical protein VII00023_15598 [Vibrio ichthyoenteri ATCC 700023]|uniref:Uncharacterized protein n=1 Tax=Vibrio ichthyoenteri ATCC 700023 TaxID=870968 RepID=F9S8B1_9VIBR|nr:hypothetical protein VII00023_15598 [Vibrio ichthyoenteri ATCC 700023]
MFAKDELVFTFGVKYWPALVKTFSISRVDKDSEFDGAHSN